MASYVDHQDVKCRDIFVVAFDDDVVIAGFDDVVVVTFDVVVIVVRMG